MEPVNTLTLMRHAKSSWKEPALGDHDRPLNARGHRDAQVMAVRLLSNSSTPPDLILCSTATRAVSTADYLRKACEQWNCQPEYQETADLYLASPQTILKILAEQAGNASRVVIIAHNPGLEDLSFRLSNGASNAPMPTNAIRQFSCPDWKTLHRVYARSTQSDARGNLHKRGVAASLIYDDYPKKDTQAPSTQE